MVKIHAINFLLNLWSISLDAAPWLLLGLVVSGLIKVWMPTRLLQRWLGGVGYSPILNAALLGTPLPLCSCSVVPAAVTLRRGGCSKGATVSFLVATPENGADSIALSYALLGLFLTIVRLAAAIFNAILAGLLTRLIDNDAINLEALDSVETSCGPQTQSSSEASCCDASTTKEKCCSSSVTCSSTSSPNVDTGVISKIVAALQYTADDLLGDIILWLGIGLILAAIVQTAVPPGAMAQWGSGLPAMLAMLLVGIPMYICATASTPLAAAMLAAGVSPGTTLVFLLAGPATNLGTIGVVRQELGNRTCVAYLVGACGGAILAGLVTDWLVNVLNISVAVQATDHAKVVPQWVAVSTLSVLAVMTARHFYKRLRS